MVKISLWLSLREPRVAIFLFSRLASPLRLFVAYFLNNIKFIPIRKYFRANNDRFPFTECILSNVCHIEKTSSLPAARCEQNFILNGIGKLYFFYNIFLSIRASIPVRTVL